jgi:hypothetical protein
MFRVAFGLLEGRTAFRSCGGIIAGGIRSARGGIGFGTGAG